MLHYRRDPKSLVKPMRILDENDENVYNEKFETKRAKFVRHILLIRHGQYHKDGKTDKERILTDLGKIQQAHICLRYIHSNSKISLLEIT